MRAQAFPFPYHVTHGKPQTESGSHDNFMARFMAISTGAARTLGVNLVTEMCENLMVPPPGGWLAGWFVW